MTKQFFLGEASINGIAPIDVARQGSVRESVDLGGIIQSYFG